MYLYSVLENESLRRPMYFYFNVKFFMIIFIHQNGRNTYKKEKNKVITKNNLNCKLCRTY